MPLEKPVQYNLDFQSFKHPFWISLALILKKKKNKQKHPPKKTPIKQQTKKPNRRDFEVYGACNDEKRIKRHPAKATGQVCTASFIIMTEKKIGVLGKEFSSTFTLSSFCLMYTEKLPSCPL